MCHFGMIPSFPFSSPQFTVADGGRTPYAGDMAMLLLAVETSAVLPALCLLMHNLMCFWSSCNIGGRCLSSSVGSPEAVLLVWGDVRALPRDTESWDSLLPWAVPTRVEQNHANSSTCFFLPLSPKPSSPFCYPAQKGSELRLQIPEQEKERTGRFLQ